MFQQILVPVDLTAKSQAAIDAAGELSQRSSTSITLLHVIETIDGASFEEFEEFYGTLTERAEESLRKWSDQLSSRSIPVEREIVFGKRGPEIVRLAEDRDCDLIVLGSHSVERSGPPTRLGTVSHFVALFATCTVLLVR